MSLSTAAQPVPFELDEHGVARVGGTRVTLESLLVGYKRGETAETLQEAFPSLALADIYAAIAYYLHNQDEVEEYLSLAEREGQLVEQRYRDPERDRAFADELKRRWAERHDQRPG